MFSSYTRPEEYSYEKLNIKIDKLNTTCDGVHNYLKKIRMFNEESIKNQSIVNWVNFQSKDKFEKYKNRFKEKYSNSFANLTDDIIIQQFIYDIFKYYVKIINQISDHYERIYGDYCFSFDNKEEFIIIQKMSELKLNLMFLDKEIEYLKSTIVFSFNTILSNS